MNKLYCCILILLSQFAFAQTKDLTQGHYLVLASFSPSHEDYAIRLTKSLNRQGYKTTYGFEATRRYWYVYLNQNWASREDCKTECRKFQANIAFADAWVHSIGLVNETAKEIPAQEPTTPPVHAVETQPTQIAVTEEKAEAPVVEEKKDSARVIPEPTKTGQTYISLFDATNDKAVAGEVEIVDGEKGKLLARVKGNEYITLPNPRSESGQLILINNTFGYRKEQLELNYLHPEADTLKPYVAFMKNAYIVNFALNKLRKGDISVLYNVYFFNDAAIMLPVSKYQLNSLLEMMQKSPTMKITLHGHTNGGGGGKIIYMGPSQNFFALTSDVKNGSGSAKELSEARAETIRQWLISQGIVGDRIAVKGWGGNKTLYDKNGNSARRNIRVEVEVNEN